MILQPQTDTPDFQDVAIAAIATGLGSGVAIIRISGKDADSIADRLWNGRRPLVDIPPRYMELGAVADGDQMIDRCLVVRMPGPRSYTGEDVVEFHCHGGALVARTVLAAVLGAGARHAQPGEFTRRAFLNGKLDLTQAEAVLDVIEAHSDMALHAANRQLSGRLGDRVDTVYTDLTELLAEVEVRLDFVDEELDWETTEQIQRRLSAGEEALASLIKSRREGEVLRHGIRLVLAGAPNAGKSSLLNLILGRDRAIVTDIPGTTRDTLEEFAHIRGIPVNIIDTAGIRETPDVIEQAGVARSLTSIDQAGIVLWLVDMTRPADEQTPPADRMNADNLILIANKIDLAPDDDLTPPHGLDNVPVIRLSAASGDGLDALYDAIENHVWGHAHHAEPDVAVNARHAALLNQAIDGIRQAKTIVNEDEYELLAVQLRTVLDHMGQITGKTLTPDILDNIFSKFCIGK